MMIHKSRSHFGWYFALLVLLVMTRASASEFQAHMDESVWSAESSIFSCRLSHQIPFYGDAVFEHLAGDVAKFQLHSSTPRFEAGKASVVARSPLWKREGTGAMKAQENMGYVEVVRGKTPVMLDQGRSERLLAFLYAGQEVIFTRAPWYGAKESAKVVLSSVNFQSAYQQYLSCLGGLLPVNFEQIRRTAVYFPSGSEELPESEMLKIENIALYVKADKSVQSFYIDGHTDSVGAREDNLELSKLRAEMVTQMLVERGVPADKIATRWHGERYPVAGNRTVKDRAENRRVTIRLEKSAGPEVPSLASTD